ncbi:unnamed protein product [Prorocentrum cordatum]|uniref:Macro domain-containing protein n=1 Tax=Prorocentrum cordatum TaxID=2364126 RepID=A0ABN9V9I6_9DINO|nr:unnamed protein product [Polarella glacialis]
MDQLQRWQDLPPKQDLGREGARTPRAASAPRRTTRCSRRGCGSPATASRAPARTPSPRACCRPSRRAPKRARRASPRRRSGCRSSAPRGGTLDAAPAQAPEPTEEPPEAGPGQEPLGRRARAAARGAAAAAQALRGTSCQLREERGDLFEVGAEWSLCHCVSKDLEMSAGIAVAFKKEFGGVPELQSQGPQVGGVVSLQKKGRFIYYLVTKNKYGGKPNVATLEASLRAMRQHMEKDGVRKLAMPKIGCGLDKLSWGTVVEIIMQVFDDMDVELLVRYI